MRSEMDKRRGRAWLRKNSERADQLVCKMAETMMDDQGCVYVEALILIEKAAAVRLEEEMKA